MGKIIKRNYESDFELTLRMPPKVGNCDFRLEFRTYRRDVVYTACRENGYLTPNLHEMGDGRFKVVLRNHGLGEGRLRVKAYCRLYNELSPDRHIVEVTPEYTGIELWSGPSDDAERLEVDVSSEERYEVGFLGSIGYTLKEEELLFGVDVNYSKLQQEKWNNGELTSFKDDAKLVYPPMVDVGDKTDLSMFYYKCNNILAIPLLDTSEATTMNKMFSNCYGLKGIPLIDTTSVIDMGSMFSNCYGLKGIPLLDTSKVEIMSFMFNGCKTLTTIPAIDCKSAVTTENMFSACIELETIPALNTANATKMAEMFYGCQNLKKIEGLDFSSVTDMINIFYNCNSLKYIKVTNLGKSPLLFINLSAADNWGVGSDENRQSVIDSLLTYSYDRASNGMEKATIRLSTATKALLTESELSDISAKGYDVVAY